MMMRMLRWVRCRKAESFRNGHLWYIGIVFGEANIIFLNEYMAFQYHAFGNFTMVIMPNETSDGVLRSVRLVH